MNFNGAPEQKPSELESPESILAKKHGLFAGKKVVFEKVSSGAESAISVGEKMSGTLDTDLKIGEPVILDNGTRVMSNVRNIREENGNLFVTTSTSEYQLAYDLNDIAGVETAKGSKYTYLEDGTTQRFKKVENKEYEPQDALVYVPDFDWVQKNLPEKILQKLGDSKSNYEEVLLEYIQDKTGARDARAYIVDAAGAKLENNADIQAAQGPIFLSFGHEDVSDFVIPVRATPKIGYYTYDSRKFTDEETGQSRRERHLGNQVVRILRKGETF